MLLSFIKHYLINYMSKGIKLLLFLQSINIQLAKIYHKYYV